MNVIFGREPITAKGVERLRYGLCCRITIPPRRERNRGTGFLRAVSDVANGLPNEKLAAIDLAEPVGERVGNRLKGANELAELLALAGIGGGQHDRLACKTLERRRKENLPFFNRLRKDLEGLSTRAQNRP